MQRRRLRGSRVRRSEPPNPLDGVEVGPVAVALLDRAPPAVSILEPPTPLGHIVLGVACTAQAWISRKQQSEIWIEAFRDGRPRCSPRLRVHRVSHPMSHNQRRCAFEQCGRARPSNAEFRLLSAIDGRDRHLTPFANIESAGNALTSILVSQLPITLPANIVVARAAVPRSAIQGLTSGLLTLRRSRVNACSSCTRSFA